MKKLFIYFLFFIFHYSFIPAQSYNNPVRGAKAAGCSLTEGTPILNHDISCYGGDNGSATAATPTGGTAPYVYQWNAGPTNVSATDSIMIAGTYTVIVTDIDGCSGSSSITITQPPAISITKDFVNATSGCNGFYKVEVSGGTAPYNYLWSPNGQTADSIYNQCSGDYWCLITDNNGCADSVCNYATAIPVISYNSSINVYPNPNNGIFTLFCHSVLPEAGEESPPIIEIYNVLGERVLTETLQPQTPKGALNEINLSGQPNGVYLYRVLTIDGTLIAVGKVVIQH